MLNRRLIVFAILALYLLIKVLRGSRLIRVLVVELFKLLGASYKVLSRVLVWVWIVAFLLDMVF